MNSKIFPLSGEWKVRSGDGEYELSVPVPGSLMEAFEKRGEFGPKGLFFRENNRIAEGLANRVYVFSRRFMLPGDFLDPKYRFFLEAEGLDTLASLRLNGKEFGKAANMHRRYRWDVGALMKSGGNDIEIRFDDAIGYVKERQEKRRLWHAYWERPDYATQGFNGIRKSHCSFGWDWGPIVPDIGIWRDIRIAGYEGARLETPLIRQIHAETQVDLEVSIPLERWSDRPLLLEARLLDPGGSTIAVEKTEASNAACPGGAAAFRFSVRNPELWWPAGMGAHPLYVLSTMLLDEEGNAVDGRELGIGLRTLRVAREKDEWGESFAFEANGIPFFARGADWIPEDVFLTRPAKESTKRLIDDAVKANFNCLRVWGGGIYPSDYFYDLCDRNGIVVWQDLMFACATYDVSDPEFLGNIRAEVEDNLERIRHHPSLGLVCGNNEMESGFVDWGIPHTEEMRREYIHQYQEVFPEISARLAPDTFYWPSSPSSGGSFERPNDPDRGDTHFWDVWHKNKEFKEYERHYFRFMSEFGFESLPSMRTIESFTLPEDRNLFSPVIEDHQRCAAGNEKILSYLSMYYRLPKDFASLVYLSQVSQAEALRHGIEHWRRNRGRCMGAIYWQYNDNWPVASWSSVDYYGRWKALHYFARRAFQNTLISCPVDGTAVELHLSNEGMEGIRGLVSWRLVDTEGGIAEEGSLEAGAKALSSSKVFSKDFSRVLAPMRPGRDGCLAVPARALLLFFAFEGSREGKAGPERERSEGLAAFLPFKSLNLGKPRISVDARRDESGRTEIRVVSDIPALFVELSSPSRDLQFSDNFFHLDGIGEKRIFVERGELSPDEAWSILIVRSLGDTY